MESKTWWVGAALLGAAFSLACEPPATTYRRSALTPSRIAEYAQVPLKPDQVEVGGTFNKQTIHTRTPVEGEPALHVASSNLVGHIRTGVDEHITFGGHVQVAHQTWSKLSAEGTPPLKEGLAWGIGPDLSVGLGDPNRLSLVGTASLTLMNVPWAAWEYTGESPGCTGCGNRRPNYQFQESGRESFLLYRLSLGPVWRLSQSLALLGGFSFQNSLRNVGFSDQMLSGSTLSNDVTSLVAYSGVDVTLPEGIFFQAQGFLFLGNLPQSEGIGVQGSAGVRF